MNQGSIPMSTSPTGTPLSLFSALVVQAALQDLLPAFTASHHVQVEPTFDPTPVLQQRITEGHRPDVIIGVTSALQALAAAGHVAAHTTTAIVRSGVGVAVARDAHQPSLRTVDELVQALVTARSVAYSRTSPSGIYFARLLDELAIAETVNKHATIVEKGLAGRAILDGRADLAIQQISELKSVTGIDVVGPLPDGVQHYTEFSAALGSQSSRPDATGLIRFLSSAAAADTYQRTGLEAL
jgi:molybdate transport system substrate-binding protein